MKFIKHTLFCLIIFSNTCFGKEFNELFNVLEPIESTAGIEKSINNAFNIMVYRLSGSNSPSNIWKIINSGNSRKDFIKSYSIMNIDNRNYVEVLFEKDLLINKFYELSIPVISNSRPVILFLIEIDNGISKPYYLTNTISDFEIDASIKNFLTKSSLSRGIFLELPELDLFEVNDFNNYEKLLSLKDLANEKYIFDDYIYLKIHKTGIDQWSIRGDIELQIDNNNINQQFMKELTNITNGKIDNLFSTNFIDTSKKNKVGISISNIKSLEDYKESKNIIESFISIRDLTISKFEIENIFYELSIYGDFDSILKEISENSFLEISNVHEDNSTIETIFIR